MGLFPISPPTLIPLHFFKMLRHGNPNSDRPNHQNRKIEIQTYCYGIPGEQKDSDQEIKTAPQEIHESGGIAGTGWFGERRGKGHSLQSGNEMWDGIAEKCTGKEKGDVAHS